MFQFVMCTSVVKELVNFCFKGGEKQFISVRKLGPTWTDDRNKLKTTFDNTFRKLVINLLIDNCCFNFDNLPFRRVIGIAKGSSNSHKVLKRKNDKKHNFLTNCFVLKTIFVL